MPVSEPFRDGDTSGFLHKPEKGVGASLVLTHGAGTDCQSPLLVAVADAFQLAGWYVLRCDLAFRRRKRSGPPFPAEAPADREGLRAAVAALQRVAAGSVCLGGHSYGGRQASMLAAENHGLVDKLLLLSYPLHPPRKPAQLRTAHFPNLRTPTLFIHGDADPFGTVSEMEAALALIDAPHQLRVIGKAGHDLKRGKFDLGTQLVEPFSNLAH